MAALISGGFLVRCFACGAELSLDTEFPSEALDRVKAAGWHIERNHLLLHGSRASCGCRRDDD